MANAPQGIFQTLSGREGEVKIPTLGVVICQMQSWKLMRRGDRGPNEGLYDLHAVFSYVNPHLFNHPEYSSKKTVHLRLGRREYRLEQAEGANISLEGRQLVMEAVKLCQ
jgi:hypothetical protein